MKWYQKEVNEIIHQNDINLTKGLTDKETKINRARFGENKMMAAVKKSLIKLFLKQFHDFLIIILLLATVIATILGEYIDAIAILIIVVINGFISFFQEQKAEKSLEKLKSYSAQSVMVLRDSVWKTITAEELVCNDLVKIKAGDRIPADLRVISSNGLEIDESILTGESLPVQKIEQAISAEDLPIADQKNMAFKSTLVTKGTGMAIVTNVGMNSEIGKIAKLLQQTEPVITPLEIKLMELGKVLIYIVLFLTALTVVIGMLHGHPLYDMFLAGISLTVAVIPEGLPAIVTVTLSIGVQRMVKQKAIVRKLKSVETLGCTTVICTDKTGTLTENKMTVTKIYTNESILTQEDLKENSRLASNLTKQLSHLLTYGKYCNDAVISEEKGRFIVQGDPTDAALLIADKMYSSTSHASYKVKKQYPFDAKKKTMSVIVEDVDGKYLLITKGAADVILPRCNTQLKDGHPVSFDSYRVNQTVKQFGESALRVIALSIKRLDNLDNVHTEHEENLTFIGLFGLMDPPRKEVKQAIIDCRNAGIKTVMITGDHKTTAQAIGEQIGLYHANNKIIDGTELSKMSMKELTDVIDEVTIFARVTPEQKLFIVEAFQNKGHVVAMTGDGVNDAPAIKASNVGISMGITGTDVTKEVASLILLDDNFNTIKEAIKEGRNIYENIRKSVRYLLASNVGEIFIMLLAMIVGLPLPLVPVQILWVNLVTDGLPAMALSLDRHEKNVMKQKPRREDEGIFARGLAFKIISRGILIGLVSLLAFIYTYQINGNSLEYARTVTFTTLVLAQLIHVFDCRSEQGIFTRNPFSNLYLVGAVLSSLLLLLAVIYIEPLQVVFYTSTLIIKDWILIICLSLLPTVLFNFKQK